jgi:hypothetical protein
VATGSRDVVASCVVIWVGNAIAYRRAARRCPFSTPCSPARGEKRPRNESQLSCRRQFSNAHLQEEFQWRLWRPAKGCCGALFLIWVDDWASASFGGQVPANRPPE